MAVFFIFNVRRDVSIHPFRTEKVRFPNAYCRQAKKREAFPRIFRLFHEQLLPAKSKYINFIKSSGMFIPELKNSLPGCMLQKYTFSAEQSKGTKLWNFRING
jgi:hypothetical protein